MLNLLFSTLLLLPGTYKQSCHIDQDEDVIEQFLTIVDKAPLERHLEWKLIAYEDNSCKTPYLTFKREYKTTDVTKESVLALAQSATYTSLTDEVTEALNMIGFCNKFNWKTHEVTDVTGQICGDYQHFEKNEKKAFLYDQQDSVLSWDNDPLIYLRQ